MHFALDMHMFIVLCSTKIEKRDDVMIISNNYLRIQWYTFEAVFDTDSNVKTRSYLYKNVYNL